MFSKTLDFYLKYSFVTTFHGSAINEKVENDVYVQ